MKKKKKKKKQQHLNRWLGLTGRKLRKLKRNHIDLCILHFRVWQSSPQRLPSFLANNKTPLPTESEEEADGGETIHLPTEEQRKGSESYTHTPQSKHFLVLKLSTIVMLLRKCLNSNCVLTVTNLISWSTLVQVILWLGFQICTHLLTWVVTLYSLKVPAVPL